MKFHYYPRLNSLCISLVEKPSTDSQEVSTGVVLDFDSDGYLVGIDINHASQIVDLSRIEAEGLPPLEKAIEMAEQGKIEGAHVVHPKSGDPYLRTKPDNKTQNNLDDMAKG